MLTVVVASQNEKTTLLGKTKADYATILQWMSWANTELLPALGSWFRPLIGRDVYNKKASEDSEKKAEAVLSFLEVTLSRKTFLVGQRLTLADLVVAAHLARGFEFVLGSDWRIAHPNAARYFTTIVHQHIYRDVAGDVKLVEEPVKYTPPKKEEKPKAEKAKVEKPKVEKKSKKEEEEEEEELVPPEPKARHILESVSAGNLTLDEWKRTYSNEETREVALPWFWEHFDSEHYSLWKVEYKYNDELTLTFMSSNLIGGFFSRLEASRKYIFGCMSVYGESNDSVIAGAFVIRGQDAKAAFDVAPDYESYEFTKLDLNNKSFVEDQWSWDRPLVVGDKTYEHADGKVFK